jgi:hypothetical protein
MSQPSTHPTASSSHAKRRPTNQPINQSTNRSIDRSIVHMPYIRHARRRPPQWLVGMQRPSRWLPRWWDFLAPSLLSCLDQGRGEFEDHQLLGTDGWMNRWMDG